MVGRGDGNDGLCVGVGLTISLWFPGPRAVWR